MLRRTLPIWSSDQPIDHAGIAKTFVGATRPFVGPATFLARTVVDVPTNAQRRVARLTTDGKYQLHVNGDRVARGPVRCDPLFQRYDVIDLTPRLLPGHNVISLIIRVEGRDTAQYQRVRGHWLETFGDGALWFELEFDDQIVPITPEQWRFSQFDAWPRGTPVGNLSLGHLETFDANLLPERWQTLEFDDAEWFPGQALISGGGGPEANFGGMSITAFPTLLPRTGSVPIEADLSPVEIVWVATGAPTTLPFEQAIYEERLEPLAGDAVKVVCEALADAAWPVTEPDTSILVRFERVHAGRPFIELTASGGEIVDIAAVESLPGEFTGALADFARARPHPTIHGSDANVARFVARAGRQRLEKYAWVGTRYLQIAIRGATPATVVHAIGSREEYQDWRETGTLETDDPFWNWLWRTGVATIRACAIDTWIDCPTREQRQWLGDVAVEFPAAWAAFGDACTPLNQQFLEQAAESQRPDGLLQMFAPGDHGVNAVLIPDWTLQWIGVLHDHFMRTGDVEILRLLPTARRALDWFERHAESSGLLRDLPFWTFFDWAGVGREHQATAPNALFAGALAQYANLSAQRPFGDSSASDGLRRRTRRIRRYGAAGGRATAAGFAACEQPDDKARSGTYGQVVDNFGLHQRSQAAAGNGSAPRGSRGRRARSWH
jgi:alpha-L-rhamnosidase